MNNGTYYTVCFFISYKIHQNAEAVCETRHDSTTFSSNNLKFTVFNLSHRWGVISARSSVASVH